MRMSVLRAATAAFFLWGFLWGSLSAQDQTPRGTFGAKVEAVRVDVLATDRLGTPLKDLTKEDFQVFEDGIEQEIFSFFSIDAPFAVGLILDTSQSTEGKLGQIQNAAVGFVKQLHPDDEVLVISFDDDVYLDSEFSGNRKVTTRAIKSTRTGGSTQLYDAVYVSMEQMEAHSSRRVMVLFSDGVDTTSRDSSSRDTLEFAKEANVLIYPIYFDTEQDVLQMVREGRSNPISRFPGGRRGGSTPPSIPGGSGGGIPGTIPSPLPVPLPVPTSRRDRAELERELQIIRQQYQVARGYLDELAKVSGGERFNARGDVTDLSAAFGQIAEQLRSLYSLAYIPSNTKRDGKYRKIKVRLKDSKGRVRARPGYYAPKDKSK